MPFSTDLYFKPSPEYRKAWSIVPQIGTIAFDTDKTKIETSSFNSSLSPVIPLFCACTIIALFLDAAINFGVLIKYGVKTWILALLIIADLILFIIPYIITLNSANSRIKIKNKIFQKELEKLIRKKGESHSEYAKREEEVDNTIKSFRNELLWGNIGRSTLIIIILGIAAFKIINYINTLPPGYNLFTLKVGYFVFFGSLLCAFLHILATENTVSYLWWRWRYHRAEYIKKRSNLVNQKLNRNENDVLDYEKNNTIENKIEYEGNFIDTRYGNTSIVNKDENVYIRYIHFIRDEEIRGLIHAQTDEKARKAIAVKCKEIQVI